MRLPYLGVVATGFLCLLLCRSAPLAADDPPREQGCGMAVYGKSDQQNFLAFDAELRAALTHNDATAIAMLVNYPLRINRADGTTIMLANPATVQAQFQEVFPAAVRTAVLTQKTEEIFCRYTGDFMYGRGEVWANTVVHGETLRYGISVISLPPLFQDPAPLPGAHRIEFVCDAEKHRVVIDSDHAGNLRYRAWNKPKFLSETPDLEIAGGTARFEGSNPCTLRIWAFKRGHMQYSVNKPGCTEATTPAEANGELTVAADGKERAHWFCW